MPNYIKNNVFSFIVLVLLGSLVYLQWRNKQMINALPKPEVVRDTVWSHKDTVVYVKPQIIETVPYKVDRESIKYIPDTNYARLVEQYHDLVKELLATHILRDSFPVDTFGYVNIIDTVSKNIIQGRSYVSHLKFPSFTEKVTIYPEPKDSWYWGTSVQFQKPSLMQNVSTGFIYKSKYDFILGASIGMSNQGTAVYGIQSYWPLKRNTDNR